MKFILKQEVLQYLKKVDISDEEVKNRTNYQRNNVINYKDGDSASTASYQYGVTTLVNDKSRVIKGGSWNDRAYWLSSGTRRFLDEDKSSATIGFRCAMDRLGGQPNLNYKKRKRKQFHYFD